MAYVSQELKKELAPRIKKICKQHGVKGTLAVRHHSNLVLNISSGVIDFGDTTRVQQINTYHYKSHLENYKEAVSFLDELLPAMNVGNHDNSDFMTDYFDVGWYVDVNIGRWDKPYALTEI